MALLFPDASGFTSRVGGSAFFVRRNMVPHAKILDNLMTRLCSSLGSTVDLRVLADNGDSLTIQVGDRTDAIVNARLEMSRGRHFAFHIRS